MNLNNILNKEELSREEIVFLLGQGNQEKDEKLFKRADEVRLNCFGNDVHLRGIIELSNYCAQNCNYCGLREENKELLRYRLKPEEVIETAHIIRNLGIYSIVLQAGEDRYYDTDMIAYIIYQIKQKTDVSITLSLGERGFDEYRTWRIAGADRYLLKHETANPKLYSVYHNGQKLEERLEHLRFIKSIGYQIGSGSIIGLPGQTLEDIADDILLCKDLNVDMAAFGTFIPLQNTPFQNKQAGSVGLTLRVMAVTRILLKKVHIPAITELAVLDDDGIINGLKAGANSVMPDLTPNPYREQYKIYPDKKYITNNPLNCKNSLQLQIESIGRKISESRGDSSKVTEKAVI
jgi:biotin synthase